MDWQGFLDKARSDLRVAERAFADGEPDPCVSRAYYAVLQAALAALLKLTDYRRVGRTWNQAGIAAEFDRRLISRRKVFQSHLAPVLADLREQRHRADYESETIGKKIAGQSLKRAQEFIKEVTSKLGG
jgi:uncharacterized protein (UPF0332 family)